MKRSNKLEMTDLLHNDRQLNMNPTYSADNVIF